MAPIKMSTVLPAINNLSHFNQKHPQMTPDFGVFDEHTARRRL